MNIQTIESTWRRRVVVILVLPLLYLKDAAMNAVAIQWWLLKSYYTVSRDTWRRRN